MDYSLSLRMQDTQLSDFVGDGERKVIVSHCGVMHKAKIHSHLSRSLNR